MASRNFTDLQTLGKDRKVITGSFKPNGITAPVVASNKGVGWTVARTGVGLFVVTFQDAYNAYDSAWAYLASATLGKLAAFTVEPTANGGAGVAGTMTIQLYDSATQAAEEQAAATNTRVHFGIMLKNTSGNF